MMELIQELGIPKKQIKETHHPDRFIVITKKTWLKTLANNSKVSEFPVHPDLDEWSLNTNSLTYSWTKVYFQVIKKFSQLNVFCVKP